MYNLTGERVTLSRSLANENVIRVASSGRWARVKSLMAQRGPDSVTYFSRSINPIMASMNPAGSSE